MYIELLGIRMSEDDVRQTVEDRKHIRSKLSLRIREFAKKNADLPDY